MIKSYVGFIFYKLHIDEPKMWNDTMIWRFKFIPRKFVFIPILILFSPIIILLRGINGLPDFWSDSLTQLTSTKYRMYLKENEKINKFNCYKIL